MGLLKKAASLSATTPRPGTLSRFALVAAYTSREAVRWSRRTAVRVCSMAHTEGRSHIKLCQSFRLKQPRKQFDAVCRAGFFAQMVQMRFHGTG